MRNVCLLSNKLRVWPTIWQFFAFFPRKRKWICEYETEAQGILNTNLPSQISYFSILFENVECVKFAYRQIIWEFVQQQDWHHLWRLWQLTNLCMTQLTPVVTHQNWSFFVFFPSNKDFCLSFEASSRDFLFQNFWRVLSLFWTWLLGSDWFTELLCVFLEINYWVNWRFLASFEMY